jgi:hypothetical protein
MKSLYETRTPEEYIQLLDQIVFEVDELMRCAEEEGEVDLEFSQQLGFFRVLRTNLMDFRAALVGGEHEFGQGKDIAFMESLRRGPRIPFRAMIDVLNKTYREGFPQD